MVQTVRGRGPLVSGVSDFWDGFYAERDKVWSGRPNGALVREVAGLGPGTAVDLGCGEGADAIWLAARGWQVTGVDVSEVALARAVRHAEAEGVVGRIEWQRLDLAEWTPDRRFDLVSAQFLHSPTELPRNRILEHAAAAVAPGGTLLIVGHESFPPWSRHPEPEEPLPTAAEVAAGLSLDQGGWELVTVGSLEREVTGPDGQTATLADSVLRARRLGA
ncbi:class I SAM-dependent methyltransferase [Arthrobacter crystallopoietes]|uniref:SAM-dependent methyltransferase n=1 Tax=Crystallibacter crystallopoietes TaxID=37928 RepID=UPI003D1AD512